jgi:CubicO group peptidase (beta-lactamase class C family)
VVLAVLFFLAIVVPGGVGIYYVTTQQNRVPVDPATVPSSMAAAPAEQYAKAIADVQRHARELAAAEGQLGLSVAVARDGEIVWAEGFGYRDRERRATVTPNTRFRTGSVSKTLTAAGSRCCTTVSASISMPQYRPMCPRIRRRSGRSPRGSCWGMWRAFTVSAVTAAMTRRPEASAEPVDDAVKTFAYEPLAFEPGTKYRFATSGWILLSAVVEGAAGEPFAAFMSREVFTPLRMERTALEGTDNDGDTVTSGAKREGDDDGPNPPAADYGCTFGSSAFLSTPSDLVRLGSATLKPGFLKAETIALFLTPLRLASGASTDFALGWKVETIPLAGTQVRVARHRASAIGGATSLYLFPERGLAIAVMDNVQNTVGVEALALQVAEAFAR